MLLGATCMGCGQSGSGNCTAALETDASEVAKSEVTEESEAFADKGIESNDTFNSPVDDSVAAENRVAVSEQAIPRTEGTESVSEGNEEEGTEEQSEVCPSTEAVEEPSTEAIVEDISVAYDPNYVVSLAIEKTKAYGKILVWENLDLMLSEGKITRAEYDEYYPYDGLENSYYSVFVETDLSKASTISGELLGSEEAIAVYIAEMMALETGPYFAISYAGIYEGTNGDFYEFRCHR